MMKECESKYLPAGEGRVWDCDIRVTGGSINKEVVNIEVKLPWTSELLYITLNTGQIHKEIHDTNYRTIQYLGWKHGNSTDVSEHGFGFEVCGGIGIPDCEYLYWFDNTHKTCNHSEFCGDYMYEGLQIFETKEDCEAALTSEKTFIEKYWYTIIIAAVIIAAIIFIIRKK